MNRIIHRCEPQFHVVERRRFFPGPIQLYFWRWVAMTMPIGRVYHHTRYGECSNARLAPRSGAKLSVNRRQDGSIDFSCVSARVAFVFPVSMLATLFQICEGASRFRKVECIQFIIADWAVVFAVVSCARSRRIGPQRLGGVGLQIVPVNFGITRPRGSGCVIGGLVGVGVVSRVR